MKTIESNLMDQGVRIDPQSEAEALEREAKSSQVTYSRFERKYRGFLFPVKGQFKKDCDLDTADWHRKDVFWASRSMEEVVGRQELLRQLKALVAYYEDRKTA
jgi:hypothetical protein